MLNIVQTLRKSSDPKFSDVHIGLVVSYSTSSSCKLGKSQMSRRRDVLRVGAKGADVGTF